jgi:hypothetical protein
MSCNKCGCYTNPCDPVNPVTTRTKAKSIVSLPVNIPFRDVNGVATTNNYFIYCRTTAASTDNLIYTIQLGAGQGASFAAGEIITGTTSSASATVFDITGDTLRVNFLNSNYFSVGEPVTGSIAGAGTVSAFTDAIVPVLSGCKAMVTGITF